MNINKRVFLNKKLLLSSSIIAVAIAISGQACSQSITLDGEDRLTIDKNNSGQWLNFEHSITVGKNSNGYLDVIDSGILESHEIYIGRYAGSRGIVNVSGPGSVWKNMRLNNQSGFDVGVYGSGSISISNGAKVITDLPTSFGLNAGSHGTATISGPASHLQVDNQLRIGFRGNGSITVKDGARLSTSSFPTIIADSFNSYGELNVDGGFFESEKDLIIGFYGIGKLNIINGGQGRNVILYSCSILDWFRTSR